MKIPEDLSCLKRPALQALCKSHGVKANGKNTEMIKALEKIREISEHSQSEEDIITDPLLSEVPAVEEIKVNKKKGGRRGGKKRKRRSESQKEDTITSGSESEPLEDPPQPPTVISASPPSACTPPKPSSRKRKRRDTHSISPNSSLCSAAKLPRLNDSVTSSQQSFTPKLSFTLAGRQPSSNGTPLSAIKNSAPSVGGPCDDSTTSQLVTPFTSICEEECLSTAEAHHSTSNLGKENIESPPFSPPLSDDPNASGSRKRKRQSTFVVSPNEEAPEEPKRERRLTFNVETNESDDGARGEIKESDGDVMAELMGMLDKRVEEIKSTPGYKPVHSATSTMASKLPVKTVTDKKFDKAHFRHFKKMKSIVTIQQEKKRKLSAGAPLCAKRPKLSDKPTSKVPMVNHRPSTAVKNVESKVVFKPTVTNTKNVNTRFSELPKTGSHLKTPKKVSINVVSGKKTTPKKKPAYDLETSLKKKPKYKPHTGPLPKFKF